MNCMHPCGPLKLRPFNHVCRAPTCRMLDGRATHVETGSYGTPTHAAPELLREGRLSPAVDLFAFGVLGESLLAVRCSHWA